MPLNSNSLSNVLSDLFQGQPSYPADPPDAGKKWANAYRRYAANALAASTAPSSASLDAAEKTLATALAAAFTAAQQAGPGGIAVLTPLMVVAFVAFWMTPLVAFAVPAPPAPATMAGVVSVTPPGVLTTSLAGVLAAGAAPTITSAQQAQAVATVLDTWTRTVMVINTPITPPGPPLPPVPLT
jgi:hypothetical protein